MKQDQIKDSVFIIDGSHFLYRAYYGIKPIIHNGQNINAFFGFCRLLKRLINKYNPNYMLLIWDSKGTTWRHQLYADYKKNRLKMPLDLVEQINYIKQFADTIGLKQIECQGIEADDLMYSFAHKLESNNVDSIIVTADKDITQALSDKITILDPFKNRFLTKDIIEQQFGFAINKIPFYYALAGDHSDCIPGVKGIGPKAAQEIVKEFDSLENLYNNLDKITNERKKNLLSLHYQDALISQQLFTLQLKEIHLNKERVSFNQNYLNLAKPLFQTLGISRLLEENDNQPNVQLSELSHKYQFICITKMEHLREICNAIKKAGHCAIDTEGTGLNPWTSKLVGISLCIKEGMAFYIPFGHKVDGEQLNPRQVIKELRPILEDETIDKYLQHAKYDALVLRQAGITLKGIKFDTLIAANLLLPKTERIGLKYLSEKFFQEKMLTFDDVVKKNGYRNFAQVPLDIATSYSAADAHQTFKLFKLFSSMLEQEPSIKKVFETIEMPLINVLLEMETNGIYLDSVTLKKINEAALTEIKQIHQEIKENLDDKYHNLNINSPKQVQEILFNHLKLKPIKKTTGGSNSTDNEVLQTLSKFHKLPGLIAHYRELSKLKSTYLDGLIKCINLKTGRIHTSFNQTEVVTGRLSSSMPNLQNIPVNKLQIRSAFKPTPGHVFISADYSQIELRILAYVSQDENLIKAFNNDEDIHALTAARLFSIDLAAVSPSQRQIGKRINFGILYGQTPQGLAFDLDISQKDAKEYIDKYMAQFPGVKKWIDHVVQETKNNGYVQTVFGRRRYLPGIYETSKSIYEHSKRMAINTTAQGTAAEIVKLGMIELCKQIQKHNLKSKILIQIHDEILIQVPESELEQIKTIVQNSLTTIVSWNIPLPISILSGNTWQEVTK